MNELEVFKSEINLVDFAASRGYVVDRKESSRTSVILRKPENDDKIVVGRQEDGHWTYFSVRDDADHGTIIDFVQRRGRPNLGQVRKELRAWLGRAPECGSPRPVAIPQPQARDRARLRQAFAAAAQPSSNRYLNSRGLRPGTLSGPRFVGTWRQDARGNVLFPHSDQQGLAGYELKNHGFTGFAAGGTKTLWRSRENDDDVRLVVTESAIDSMSHYQLRPDSHTRYASTGGQWSPQQRELLAHELRRLRPGVVIVAAFDADESGEKLSHELGLLAGAVGRTVIRELPPSGKDWNEALQLVERDYIASLRPSAGR